MRYARLGIALFLSLQSLLVCANDKVLNIYSWASYIPESVVREFEIETGIRVNHSTYPSNEVLYAKLKANPNAGYDIIVPSTYFISRMLKQDLLQAIDHKKIPNFRHINPAFLHKNYDPKNDYSVPFLWNATGIVVNRKFHPSERITTWQDLWSPLYTDQLLILDDTREAFSAALLSLGYSVNEKKPEFIEKAYQQLKKLKNNIKLFNLDTQRSIYLDEDISLGMAWNGDVFLASLENKNLAFIFPKEGFIIALDSLAIPKNAKHVEYAHQFIDFLLRPAIARKISLETGFSTSNLSALKLLPLNVQQSPVLYPDAVTLERGYILEDVGEAAKLYEQYFERLKLEE